MILPGNISLFEGITPEESAVLLECVSARERRFSRGETVIAEGDRVESIGIVAAGSVRVTRTDLDGNRMIIATFGAGSLFGESFACAGVPRAPVSVVAETDVVAVFLPFARLLRPCESSCGFHARLIENMVRMLARKNLTLNSRIEIAGMRSIRDKVRGYVAALARERGLSRAEAPGGEGQAPRRSMTVDVPFSRGELADYLCVDRSALSRELGRMRDEGILDLAGRRLTIFD